MALTPVNFYDNHHHLRLGAYLLLVMHIHHCTKNMYPNVVAIFMQR